MTFAQRTQLRDISRRLSDLSLEIRDLATECGVDLVEARTGVQKGAFLCTDSVLADEQKPKLTG